MEGLADGTYFSPMDEGRMLGDLKCGRYVGLLFGFTLDGALVFLVGLGCIDGRFAGQTVKCITGETVCRDVGLAGPNAVGLIED